MAIPTQIGFYERQPSGWFIDLRDGSGPYKTADGVTFTLAGVGGGGGGGPPSTEEQAAVFLMLLFGDD